MERKPSVERMRDPSVEKMSDEFASSDEQEDAMEHTRRVQDQNHQQMLQEFINAAAG